MTEAQFNYELYKGHVLKILTDVRELVEADRYEEIEQYTFVSTSGDGWGLNNDVIDFSMVEDDEGVDILEACLNLKRLKSLAEES